MFFLVGGDSEIGGQTFCALKSAGAAVEATTRRLDRHAIPGRSHLDLAGDLSGWVPPPAVSSACIFAAVARLAACAADPVGSFHVNVTQTLSLIDRLLEQGAHVVFLSTNQVFDGEIPHVAPDAATHPISEYGRQKAQTEAALQAKLGQGAPLAILRLAKVVSPEMSLIHNWIANLSVGRPVKAFTDMMMAPIPIELVAKAIIALMRDRAIGVFQLSGPTDVSYLDVAYYIARQVGAVPGLVKPEMAADAGQPLGATPRHTTLDSAMMLGRYGIAVPEPWSVVDSIVAARQQAPPRA